MCYVTTLLCCIFCEHNVFIYIKMWSLCGAARRGGDQQRATQWLLIVDLDLVVNIFHIWSDSTLGGSAREVLVNEY